MMCNFALSCDEFRVVCVHVSSPVLWLGLKPQRWGSSDPRADSSFILWANFTLKQGRLSLRVVVLYKTPGLRKTNELRRPPGLGEFFNWINHFILNPFEVLWAAKKYFKSCVHHVQIYLWFCESNTQSFKKIILLSGIFDASGVLCAAMILGPCAHVQIFDWLMVPYPFSFVKPLTLSRFCKRCKFLVVMKVTVMCTCLDSWFLRASKFMGWSICDVSSNVRSWFQSFLLTTFQSLLFVSRCAFQNILRQALHGMWAWGLEGLQDSHFQSLDPYMLSWMMNHSVNHSNCNTVNL